VNYERNKKGARFFETQCSLIHEIKLSSLDSLRTLYSWPIF